MGQVIPFSAVEHYLDSIEKTATEKGTILDTNILISAGYEIRDSHHNVVEVLELLRERSYPLYATVNTRSEYLEFQRRLILTENLLDMTDEFSQLKIPKTAKAVIQTLKGSLKKSMLSDSERDEVFNESQLKKIKKEFSAGPHSGQKGWLEICNLFLKNQISEADQDLVDRGIVYISPNDSSQQRIFNGPLKWEGAVAICEGTGTAFSDSMILNALMNSHLSFVVTLDFDVGYAALSNPKMKDAVVPDRLFKEYKKYHFPV